MYVCMSTVSFGAYCAHIFTVLEGSSGSDDGPVVSVVPEVI